MAKIIGIDLGTTNSCVAVMEGGEAQVIANAEGNRTTPSVVAFTKDGERLVGGTAKRQAVANPDKTISSIKRHMGSNYSVNIDENKFTPQEISSMILGKLKQDAEAYLGESVTQAVITVPAYFTDAQRQATKDAGKIAGLDVMRIINEPTAAALAYGIDKDTTEAQKVLIYDLGGGTFDVSVLELDNGMFQVLATCGDNKLGGDDFDRRVAEYVLEEFKKTEHIDLSTDKMAMQRIMEASEKAKIELSSMTKTNINLPFITMDATGPKSIDIDLSKAKFDALTSDLVERTMKPLSQALSDAGLTANDISKVILVGGSTRIPAVVEAVKQATGKEPYKGINPDECVAIGAAIQGGVLTGDVQDMVLVDVTPLSLGIETAGGVFTVLIPRNTSIPTSKSQVFSTYADNQPAVDVHVLQGERSMAADNKTLGRFVLDGIAPAPRGIPQIEITFDIDANGIVNVKAMDKATNKTQSVTITASSNLSDADIDEAIKNAEKYAEEDKKRKEAVDARNEAEQLIFAAEKFMKENDGKVTEEETKKINESLAKAKADLEEKKEAEDIRKIIEEVSAVTGPIFTRIYQESAQAQANAQAEQAQHVGSDDVNDDVVVDDPEIN